MKYKQTITKPNRANKSLTFLLVTGIGLVCKVAVGEFLSNNEITMAAINNTAKM
jgi:uncharacterized protein (UPF0333 family)